MEETLKDRAIIVSGASGGLGKSTVRHLSAMGAILGLIDIDEKVHAVAHEISEAGGKAASIATDITVKAEVEDVVGHFAGEFGHIDGLVNIAAIYRGITTCEFTELPEEEWDRVMQVNVKGTWLLTGAVIRRMKERKTGSVVNIASSTFFSGTEGLLHYVASKGAVVGMTRTMARETGRYGIRINCVAPGLLPTEATLERVPEEYLQGRTDRAALGRLASPEEISGIIGFLLSDASSAMTGQTILADAGRLFI